jgi:hypothetical protein
VGEPRTDTSISIKCNPAIDRELARAFAFEAAHIQGAGERSSRWMIADLLPATRETSSKNTPHQMRK